MARNQLWLTIQTCKAARRYICLHERRTFQQQHSFLLSRGIICTWQWSAMSFVLVCLTWKSFTGEAFNSRFEGIIDFVFHLGLILTHRRIWSWPGSSPAHQALHKCPSRHWTSGTWSRCLFAKAFKLLISIKASIKYLILIKTSAAFCHNWAFVFGFGMLRKPPPPLIPDDCTEVVHWLVVQITIALIKSDRDNPEIF